MKKTESNSKNRRPAVKPITSLKEFQALVDEPCTAVFEMETASGKQLRSVTVRRITPALAEQARQLERKIQPPWRKEMNGYDEYDPAYLEKRETVSKKVRSLIVYACCAPVSAAKPGLTAVEDIHAFVQGLLAENILNIISLKAQQGGINLDVEVEERANFTSTAGSES